ncbi:MAG: hypothetical protein A3E01_10740 [Gammaproteobacteria bacterium RIFCSPHIGHO2_12_FULL_63_22]|nr:MAG: hypothetical protein A3E01_10740 [Gammaproteobacteria bacterium RIFCSPHIGHO2_12_FULL_63_22]
MVAVVEKLLLASSTTVLSTGLNSLANNSLAISSAFDNTIGQTGDGYTLCQIELALAAPGGTLTANKSATGWFLQAPDGTNYEDGGTSTTPARAPDFVIPLAASSSAQRVTIKDIPLPPGLSKVLLKNDGTGQTWNASGNTLILTPYTRELV